MHSLKATSQVGVTYFGVLRAQTSWAKVCRELLLALVDLGVGLNIYERKGFLYDPDLPISETLLNRIDQRFRSDIVLTFEHPATYHYLKGAFKIGILTYESTVVPPKWIAAVREHLSLLLVPSRHCRDLFVAGGVPADQIEILPHGFRPDIYRADLPALEIESAKQFRFLNVSLPHKREGIDVLLRAYAEAFDARDDTALVIKANYLPGPKSRPFEWKALRASVDQLSSRPDGPQVLLMTAYLSESDMARLYCAADWYVSATRGEGFGMAFLEAAACGLPSLVTGWGGQLDLLNPANATFIDHRMALAGEMQYDCRAEAAMIAEADPHDLAKKMRAAFEGRLERRRPTAEQLAPYHWSAVGGQLLEIIAQRHQGR